jgi:hypothetical protein
MEKFFEQLKKLREGVVLRSERKAQIRQELEAFMRGHEAIVARPARARLFGWRPVFAAMSILVLLGTGTTYASEQVLPDSPLYGVKLLKEQVQAALITDPEVKAEWEAELAERRLSEAAQLAANGKLSSELQAELEARFEAHSEKVGDRIKLLEEKDNFQASAGLASRFEASLDAHNRILSRLSERTEVTTNQKVGALKTRVEAKLRTVKDTRVNAEAKNEASVSANSTTTPSTSIPSTTTPATSTSAIGTSTTTSTPSSTTGNTLKVTAAENKIEAAAKVLAEVRDYLVKKKGDVTVLQGADSLLLNAKAKVQAGAFADAFRDANESIRKAQEAKIILRTERALKLDLRLNIGDDNGKGDDKKVERGRGQN